MLPFCLGASRDAALAGGAGGRLGGRAEGGTGEGQDAAHLPPHHQEPDLSQLSA